jgi:hypothetical protein
VGICGVERQTLCMVLACNCEEGNEKRTSNFSSRISFLANADIDPVEASDSTTEAGGESSQLSQISKLAFSHEEVRHAFHVHIDPNENVQGIGIFIE